MKKRKLLILAITAAFALALLAGCVTQNPTTTTPPATESNTQTQNSNQQGQGSNQQEQNSNQQEQTPPPQNSTSNLNEKVLNVYTAFEDDQIADYLEEFQSLHPDVTVNITRDSTGIITAKLLAEKANPMADVVWGLSAASLLVLESQGMLETYAPVGLERIMPEFRDSANPPVWVGCDAWETAFLVNTAVLAEHGIDKIPESYDDLLDPIYKGLIAMPNPASSGTGTLTVNGLLHLKGEEAAWAYLDKLHENIAVYLHSGSAPAKNTATGEYGIGISFGYRCIKSAKDIPDIGVVVFPKEGSGWDVEANAMMKRAEGSKEIAKTFLDWAINDKNIEKYAQGYPIIATGIKDYTSAGYSVDPVAQLINGLDLKWCAENRDRVLDEWTRRYDGKSAAQ
ncbi:MAG: ABC transporter substrate-binding protein [Oscillospiraceae bacterium]|jgi:iron(III) transport system substrate-binding protein|nr:ABC transporter substrate-binding protein [Oscillospiraceae bacterium]